MSMSFAKLYNRVISTRGVIRDEPISPIVSLPIPGPNTQKYLEGLNKFSQDYRTVLTR